MGQQQARIKVSRGAKWAKGHSSDCNPKKNAHRLLAAGRLGAPSVHSHQLANVPVDERNGTEMTSINDENLVSELYYFYFIVCRHR
jgi:hypothetical protein